MTADSEARLRAAVEAALTQVPAIIADAIVTALREGEDAHADAPERLLSIAEASERLGRLSRSALYEGPIAHGELRTCRVGRRRMVPASAIAEYIERAAGGAH